MCGGGGRGGDQLVATKEIRTPKAASNKSTCQTPQKKNQKNQRGVYERKHKAKDYNTISKL
jgi:NAD(P)H-hydrate repair Nnr-like enzyme with NAD(P)H-hydrate epimerase domain